MTCRSVVVLGSFAPSLLTFRGPLLQALVAQGHRVTACAPGATPTLVKQLAAMGVNYQHVSLVRTSLNPAHDLAALSGLVRLMRVLRPDVLLAYTVKPVVYGSLAARLAGVPVIASMIEGLGFAFGEVDGTRRRLIRSLVTGLYRAAMAVNQRVFFLNPDDRDLFIRLGLVHDPDRAVLIDGCGVDLTAFDPSPLPTRPAFLMLARLIAAKGVRDYAAAAHLLHQRYPDVPCGLAGDFDEGPDALTREEVTSWVAAGDIEFLGWLDDVWPAIAQSTALVLPSYYREGQPRTVLEAMAMGRPVITCDTPGCRETVAHGINGFLVPPREPEALAMAMARLLDEPELVVAMGHASRARAEAKYDVHVVNRTILDSLEL